MKKYLYLFLITLFLSTNSYANWYQDILDAIYKQSGITNGILNDTNSIQRDILSSQRDINELMRQVNQSVTGHSGWGNYQFQDHQSYGSGAEDWTSVMRMADLGQGDGRLGRMMNSLVNEFPSDRTRFNRGINNSGNQRYYALKSQTILAARAASQLDYNKIQEQIAYQQMLQQQIEKTKDLKGAVDLNNRLQVEGNLISLQILRHVALANQQQALTEQATVNLALSNAKFLTK